MQLVIQQIGVGDFGSIVQNVTRTTQRSPLDDHEKRVLLKIVEVSVPGNEIRRLTCHKI